MSVWSNGPAAERISDADGPGREKLEETVVNGEGSPYGTEQKEQQFS